MSAPRIHPTAEVSLRAQIGEGTAIWHEAQVREGARIGRDCIIGKGVYVDFDVIIGDRCKLQNGVYVYHGATLEDGVFLGPRVMLLNDKNPRAVNPKYAIEKLDGVPHDRGSSDAVAGSLKSNSDWQVSPTRVAEGAGIGGGAIILPGVTVGRWAIVGAGSVATRDVPDYGLVFGNPARLRGFVCPCGQRLELAAEASPPETAITVVCDKIELASNDVGAVREPPLPGSRLSDIFENRRTTQETRKLLHCPACKKSVSIQADARLQNPEVETR